MRIVAYVHFMMPFHYAGSEVMLLNLLKVAQQNGHEVSVIATYEKEAPDTWEYDGVTCYTPTSKFSGFELLTRLDPDIIITHHDVTVYASGYAKYLNVPLVQLIHNNGINNPGPHPELQHGADFVIWNTEWVKEWYGKRYEHIPSVVVHPPVFAKDHATTPGDMVTLVNLNMNKGAGIMYELAKRLPHVEFLGVEGGHGNQVFEMWPNVSFQQQTTDMRNDVWARTKVLLVPSIYESYGMVAVEALASGIPVLATPTPGLKESLQDAGTFIGRDDIDAWCYHIERLLNDKSYYAERSDAASRRSAAIDPESEFEAALTELERLVTKWPTQRLRT